MLGRSTSTQPLRDPFRNVTKTMLQNIEARIQLTTTLRRTSPLPRSVSLKQVNLAEPPKKTGALDGGSGSGSPGMTPLPDGIISPRLNPL